MNYTRGPWSIQLRSASARYVDHLTWLSTDENSGPLFIVDMHDKVIAAVVHREGRGQGFSETANNARIIEHAPELFEKSRALVQFLRNEDGYSTALVEDLEKLLSAIEGKAVVSSEG